MIRLLTALCSAGILGWETVGMMEGQGLNWRAKLLELMLNKLLDLQPVPDLKSIAIKTVEHRSEISEISSLQLRYRKTRTQVGAELPRLQTQSRLKHVHYAIAHWAGPRCTVAVPREDRARATRRQAPWRARSYAGAAQYPCAGHKSGRPPVAPRTTPMHPGPMAQGSPAWPEGLEQIARGGSS